MRARYFPRDRVGWRLLVSMTWGRGARIVNGNRSATSRRPSARLLSRQIVDEVTARRRKQIAAIVARMPSAQRTGLVAALRAFTDAGGEAPVGETTPEAAPLGWS